MMAKFFQCRSGGEGVPASTNIACSEQSSKLGLWNTTLLAEILRSKSKRMIPVRKHLNIALSHRVQRRSVPIELQRINITSQKTSNNKTTKGIEQGVKEME